jgi:hypothetical protein
MSAAKTAYVVSTESTGIHLVVDKDLAFLVPSYTLILGTTFFPDFLTIRISDKHDCSQQPCYDCKVAARWCRVRTPLNDKCVRLILVDSYHGGHGIDASDVGPDASSMTAVEGQLTQGIADVHENQASRKDGRRRMRFTCCKTAKGTCLMVVHNGRVRGTSGQSGSWSPCGEDVSQVVRLLTKEVTKKRISAAIGDKLLDVKCSHFWYRWSKSLHDDDDRSITARYGR